MSSIKTKSDTAKFLLGQPTSSLAAEWEEALRQKNWDLMDTDSLLPFKGVPRLPTRLQVVHLYYVYREQEELITASQTYVAELVARQILKYWRMANIKTVLMVTVVKRVLQIKKEFEARRKCRKSHEGSLTEKKKREDFSNSLQKIFEIAAADAEEKIQQDRFLVRKKNGQIEKKEMEDDLTFLEDQR